MTNSNFLYWTKKMTSDTRVLSKSKITTDDGEATLWIITDATAVMDLHLNGILQNGDIAHSAESDGYFTVSDRGLMKISKEEVASFLQKGERLINPWKEAEMAVFFGWKHASDFPPPKDGESIYAFIPELYHAKLNPDAVVECTHVEDGKDGFYVAAVWNDKTHHYDTIRVKPQIWREISSPVEVSPREYEIYQLLKSEKQ